MQVKDRKGNLLQMYSGENLVVNAGRNSAARLVGGSGANKEITQIAFGTSGTSPSPTDADLTDKFIKAIDSVAYPQTGAVEFSWTLGFSEANGKSIREFGLFNTANELFSRKTRDVIEKTSDIEINGTWTIQF